MCSSGTVNFHVISIMSFEDGIICNRDGNGSIFKGNTHHPVTKSFFPKAGVIFDPCGHKANLVSVFSLNFSYGGFGKFTKLFVNRLTVVDLYFTYLFNRRNQFFTLIIKLYLSHIGYLHIHFGTSTTFFFQFRVFIHIVQYKYVQSCRIGKSMKVFHEFCIESYTVCIDNSCKCFIPVIYFTPI